MTRVLVAGVGNIFLSDDGFGSEVARRLAGHDLGPGVTVKDFGIGGVHLAYELANGYDLAILVDATAHGAQPGTVSVIEPDIQEAAAQAEAAQLAGEAPLMDAHGMEPVSVLSMIAAMGRVVGEDLRDAVSRVLIVGCEPADVTEGMGLSAPVAAAIDGAVRTVQELITTTPAANAAG